MDSYYKLFLENSSKFTHELYDLGYTPHILVKEAMKEHISVFEYIAILFDLI